MNDYRKTSFESVIVFGLDLYNFLEVRLVKIFSSIFKDILGFFFQNFEQKNGNHVLQLWVFT